MLKEFSTKMLSALKYQLTFLPKRWTQLLMAVKQSVSNKFASYFHNFRSMLTWFSLQSEVTYARLEEQCSPVSWVPRLSTSSRDREQELEFSAIRYNTSSSSFYLYSCYLISFKFRAIFTYRNISVDRCSLWLLYVNKWISETAIPKMRYTVNYQILLLNIINRWDSQPRENRIFRCEKFVRSE